MITCKIALISKPVNTKINSFINIGEIYDSDMKKDTQFLYDIHKNTKYMGKFKACFKNNNIQIDNIEDIHSIQRRYNLTRRILAKGQKKDTILFDKPQLYDITCMVPLFPTKIYPQYTINDSILLLPLQLFLIFPYSDPIIRGELLDRCLELKKDRKIYFCLFGNIYRKNTRATYNFSRDYLLECGIHSDDIICGIYDKFPECIQESLLLVEMALNTLSVELFIAVARDDMSQVMNHIRQSKNNLGFRKKIQLICN